MELITIKELEQIKGGIEIIEVDIADFVKKNSTKK